MKKYFSQLPFYVAQFYRYIPFNSQPLLHRSLQPWCRWPIKSRKNPFKAGLGYWLTGKTDNLFYIAGLHEAQYLQVIHERLPAAGMLIDIGANAGTSVLWLHFAKPLKKLSFLAVEALPDNASILRENIALNPGVTCAVAEVALSNREGEIDFGSAGAGDGSARTAGAIKDSEWAGRTKVRVKTTKLDLLVAAGGYKPNFLFIDVEGFAEPVLEGAIITLETHRPEIGLEIHSLDELNGCEQILFARGYKIVWESFRYGHHRIYSCATK